MFAAAPEPPGGAARPASGAPFEELQPLPAVEDLRHWISAMKQAPRGPFRQIRWYCRDGSILPPRPYACRDFGGGVQHGEWNDQSRLLRSHGFLVANVLAALDPNAFRTDPQWLDSLKQILLEQFLIEADDGWIFRQARYYPGALQIEDENAFGRALLLELLTDPGLLRDNFLVLREAVRLLPHGRFQSSLTELRQLARAIEDRDPGFQRIRAKLHVRPDARDAERVRSYAVDAGDPALAEDYRHLAEVIADVYRPKDLAELLTRTGSALRDPVLADALRQTAGFLSTERDPRRRHARLAGLMSELREALPRVADPVRRLDLLDASLDLEFEAFQLGSRWLAELPLSERRQRLEWLRNGARIDYGMGLLSRREFNALEQGLAPLMAEPLTVQRYKAQLDYLARLSRWAENTLRFHFAASVARLEPLDPLFANYIPDRLRGSPLAVQVAVLDSLQRDAAQLSGLRHEVFGRATGHGLFALNPGLARGTLRIGRPGSAWDREGIYLLPETLADLPPVAGILTRGSGNSLSHVQLLARNLGIPNVAVADSVAERLLDREGQPVVLAVSPAGAVKLVADGPPWDDIFKSEEPPDEILIRPDLDKLDLTRRGFIPLHNLRASDSGRSVGPKAANLGELKHLFPDLVTDGLAIPFGRFRDYLEQPLRPGGLTLFQWLEEQYAMLEQIREPRARDSASANFLRRLRERITSGDLGRDFVDTLRDALVERFGPDGSYGVFVRSDTNVEDLKGFSGAGLNLTLPHVVGFNNILRAILQVWASPFTERAYGWRQAHMDNPAEVYASVLLLRSVPADKSGVMVTLDTASGEQGRLSVAVNEGIGGAVAGQRAEELLIDRSSGRVQLLARTSEPFKWVLLPGGGLGKIPASGGEKVLTIEETQTLLRMADSLSVNFPGLVDGSGEPAPADIEFGFVAGRFVLFQIRPYLTSARPGHSLFLSRLDRPLREAGGRLVELRGVPGEDAP